MKKEDPRKVIAEKVVQTIINRKRWEGAVPELEVRALAMHRIERLIKDGKYYDPSKQTHQEEKVPMYHNIYGGLEEINTIFIFYDKILYGSGGKVSVEGWRKGNKAYWKRYNRILGTDKVLHVLCLPYSLYCLGWVQLESKATITRRNNKVNASANTRPLKRKSSEQQGPLEAKHRELPEGAAVRSFPSSAGLISPFPSHDPPASLAPPASPHRSPMLSPFMSDSSSGSPPLSPLANNGSIRSASLCMPPAIFARPPANFADPAANFMDPAANFVDPAANFMDPAANFVDPAANFAHPPANFAHPPANFAHPPANFAHPPANFAHPPANFAHPPANFAHPAANFARPPVNFAQSNAPLDNVDPPLVDSAFCPVASNLISSSAPQQFPRNVPDPHYCDLSVYIDHLKKMQLDLSPEHFRLHLACLASVPQHQEYLAYLARLAHLAHRLNLAYLSTTAQPPDSFSSAEQLPNAERSAILFVDSLQPLVDFSAQSLADPPAAEIDSCNALTHQVNSPPLPEMYEDDEEFITRNCV